MKLGAALERWWRQLTGRPQDEHEQRLMQLYWNRAELKKELNEAQEQRQKLLAALESHQTAIRRAGEQIDELAAYLGRPEVAAQALLYFQLRALWLANGRKLQRFVADLKEKQEERERRRHDADVRAARAERLAAIDQSLLNAQSVADSLAARIALLERKLAGLRYFWNYRRRRAVNSELLQVRTQQQVAGSDNADLVDERAAVAAAPLDAFAGVSTEGRRMINTAAIAYAEWLVLNLPVRALAPLARHAISVQIFDAQLGTAQECRRWMECLAQALDQLRDSDSRLAGLKDPTERLRARAQYRSNQDTVPLVESIADVAIVPDGAASKDDRVPAKVNVLADDYWSLGQVLIR